MDRNNNSNKNIKLQIKSFLKKDKSSTVLQKSQCSYSF